MSPAPENHSQVRVMMSPSLRNGFSGAGNGLVKKIYNFFI
jgi:hypothetical protein